MSNLLQFLFVILLVFLPTIVLAGLSRLPSIYQLSQRSPRTRSLLILGSGILCFTFTFLILAWLATALFYSVAEFYFDTTFGLIPNITRADVLQLKWAAINEMWFRQIISSGQGISCFNQNTTVCQLADVALKTGSPESTWFILFGIALVPTLFTLLISRKFTNIKNESKRI